MKSILEKFYYGEIHVTAACEGLQDLERGFSLGAFIMLNIITNE